MERFLGGRGLISHTLYRLVGPEIDPLAPGNVLAFGVGPLVGTLVPSSCVWNVGSKSPLTGIIALGTAKGFFGIELRRAGVDLLVLKGASKEPVYLHISDGCIELREAGHLWGKDVWETNNIIRTELGDPYVRIAAIGQAGENLVSYANIIGDMNRAAGRGGLGAVMGSKGLKAVAVRSGRSVHVANHGRLLDLVRRAENLFSRTDYLESLLRKGTIGETENYSRAGVLETKNFQTGVYRKVHRLRGEIFERQNWIKSKACGTCMTACSHSFVVRKGRYRNSFGEAPQLTVTGQFGSGLDIPDPAAMLKIHTECNRYGLDEISLGATLSFVMECHEKGILQKQDVEEIDLTWGDEEAVLSLIGRVARRQGIGDLLSRGTKRLSEEWGEETRNFAMHVKGLELVMVELRGLNAWALGTAVSTVGGAHNKVGVYMEPYAGIEERTRVEGKADLVKYMEELRAVEDSLGVCHFLSDIGGYYDRFLTKLVNAVTGKRMSFPQLLRIGERIVAVERAFDVREGITSKDDTLPDRFLKTPLPDGPCRGQVVPLQEMLERYYELRQWDDEGRPVPDKLRSLGLEEIVRDIHGYPDLKHGKPVR